ncbi:MAG: OPT/YSL family transporter, partial [Paludibacter sp.]|nr:OPT/YSL family transporter [Paludibacter sp.]
DQAKPLILAGLIGGLYDFVIATFGAWSENFSTRILPFGEQLADKAKLVFKNNLGAAVLGLGYIIGLKYSAIIVAGSALVWFIIVPLMPLLGDGVAHMLNPNFSMALADVAPELIFKEFARHIGIGGIAMAGIIGIIRSWGIIKGAIGLASKEFKTKGPAVSEQVKRTQRDISMKIISIGVILALISTFIFFYVGVVDFNLLYAVVGILVVAIIAFLFTTVAANAIAIVGTNPVSGMTLMTLILSSVVMVAVGLKGEAGMVASLVIGGVVCTALSMAGGFITDLKIGYWIGTTPAKQQTWKFLGTLVSAATVGGVIMVLNKTYGFTGDNALVAPQANAMAAVIEPLMSGAGAPWALYGIGALIAIVLTFFKVPALAFALGMFIPMELNAPLLVGGLVSWYVSTRSTDKALNTARHERGTLLASGFIAGGALMGVVSAGLRFGGFNWMNAEWVESNGAQWLGLVMYGAIIGYLIWDSLKAKKEI